jgi:tetratricopeptide (TPR) repeat protein
LLRKIQFFYLFLFCLFSISIESLNAQYKKPLDVKKTSISKLDSIKNQRAIALKALEVQRKRRTDSLAKIQRYKLSKHYKDSVTKKRLQKTDSIKRVRMAALDAMKQARLRKLDSINLLRNPNYKPQARPLPNTKQTNSKIDLTKNSKRYNDSLLLMQTSMGNKSTKKRLSKADSLQNVRKLLLAEKAAQRKLQMDSIAAVRKQKTDSVFQVKKSKNEQLEELKKRKENIAKSNEKKSEEKFKLALELKIQKKREAFSNENMLKKGWYFPRNFIQNLFTHYNYHFNAQRKIVEACANMDRQCVDKFDTLINLFTYSPKDSSLYAADMDSIVRKASLGLQIHDPRTKWADDLYFLMGKAYYYKGDYENAIAAFRYAMLVQDLYPSKGKATSKKSGDKLSVVKNKKKGPLGWFAHKPVKNDAILWLCRTLVDNRKYGEAESVLDLLESDRKTDRFMKGKVALEHAYLAIKDEDFVLASDMLSKVTSTKKITKSTKLRASFLLGQLSFSQHAYDNAINAYSKSLDYHPNLAMDFEARKGIALSKVALGNADTKALASLKDMLHDNKYSNYQDQVYYMLGKLSLQVDTRNSAISYFQKGLHLSKIAPAQKAILYAALANVYFDLGSFKNAKMAFDSLDKYKSNAAKHAEVVLALSRSKVIDEIVIPIRSIKQKDSLIHLANLSEKEQKAIIKKTIKQLERIQADSANQNNTVSVSIPTIISKETSSWYFGNANQMQSGAADFKRKWGSRPNVDHWRRLASIGQNNTNVSNEQEAKKNTSDSSMLTEKGIPNEAYLLSLLPKTKVEQEKLLSQIQKHYIDLANAYLDNLEDQNNATHTLDTMLKRFPRSLYKPEALYMYYRMALKQNNVRLAQRMVTQLKDSFSQSKWAMLVKPSAEQDWNVQNQKKLLQQYDVIYSQVNDRNFDSALVAINTINLDKYTDTMKQRIYLLKAISYVGINNYIAADSFFKSVKPFIKHQPLADWVMAIEQQINIHIKQDTVSKQTSLKNNVKYSFSNDTNVIFNVVIYTTLKEPLANALKASIKLWNTNTIKSNALKVEGINLANGIHIIYVSSFPNLLSCTQYIFNLTNSILMKQIPASDYAMYPISNLNYSSITKPEQWISYFEFWKANFLRK